MDKLKQDILNLLGTRLTSKQIAAFEVYERELCDWNTRFNLTAIRDVTGIRSKHFLDSISCLLAFKDKTPTRLIDIGTGAGFPGIPIKILCPNLRLTLVESVGKKAEFCRHVTTILGLDKVEILQARAEEVGQLPAHREQYDWAVARAVANLPTLMEYLLPLVRVGGAALAQKGENGPAEAHAADHPAHLLGGHLRQLYPVTLPGVAEERYLIVFDKVAATPPKYPRRVGVPLKSPLA
ncbi:MAG: 16S rRNA (guanine(527)-N(7))-methyltransferase RsmG [Chloroflexi bacterium]|jgi:16S rRNA (guanine527-N7)-methyltransferase|nr:16S rRNA (guanine(527)-N(7))-methyltransferase RsmG [Anaerolineaceae bacterium]NMB87774.1 16S rRNA (guanine(527)-N(7))-methyltransferase RsmG [Chloroflexota bacterium]